MIIQGGGKKKKRKEKKRERDVSRLCLDPKLQNSKTITSNVAAHA